MATKVLPTRLQSVHSSIVPRIQRRTFLPNPFAAVTGSSVSAQPQILTARRTLPYSHHPIYAIVSDIPSYSTFLPFCEYSEITRWSAPDATYHRRWPSEARLQVGWKGINESFTSRQFFVPGRIVESVSGATETDLPSDEIRHHLQAGDVQGQASREEEKGGLLTHLRSRWTIEPLAKESTEVTLSLEFAFANPLYGALSAGVAPKIADTMIKAFEERITAVLDRDPEMAKATLKDMEIWRKGN